MKQDIGKAYKSTVRMADRLLAANKLMAVDFHHGDAENVYYDADIMVSIVKRWRTLLQEYRSALEETEKDAGA